VVTLITGRSKRELGREDELEVLRLLRDGCEQTGWWVTRDNRGEHTLNVEFAISGPRSHTRAKVVALYSFQGLTWGNNPTEPLVSSRLGRACNNVSRCSGHHGFNGFRVSGRLRGQLVQAYFSHVSRHGLLFHHIGEELLQPVWEYVLTGDEKFDAKLRDIRFELARYYWGRLVEWLGSAGTFLSDESDRTTVIFHDRAGRPMAGVIWGKGHGEYEGAAPWRAEAFTVYHTVEFVPSQPDFARQVFGSLDLTSSFGSTLRPRLLECVDGARRGLKGPHRK
jgi:hypothetical protein